MPIRNSRARLCISHTRPHTHTYIYIYLCIYVNTHGRQTYTARTKQFKDFDKLDTVFVQIIYHVVIRNIIIVVFQSAVFDRSVGRETLSV